MKIAIGSDHRGWSLKERIKKLLVAEGHEIVDRRDGQRGSGGLPRLRHPRRGEDRRGRGRPGYLICGSGIGVSIAANKVKGARAALVLDRG